MQGLGPVSCGTSVSAEGSCASQNFGSERHGADVPLAASDLRKEEEAAVRSSMGPGLVVDAEFSATIFPTPDPVQISVSSMELGGEQQQRDSMSAGPGNVDVLSEEEMADVMGDCAAEDGVSLGLLEVQQPETRSAELGEIVGVTDEVWADGVISVPMAGSTIEVLMDVHQLGTGCTELVEDGVVVEEVLAEGVAPSSMECSTSSVRRMVVQPEVDEEAQRCDEEWWTEMRRLTERRDPKKFRKGKDHLFKQSTTMVQKISTSRSADGPDVARIQRVIRAALKPSWFSQTLVGGWSLGAEKRSGRSMSS